MKRFSILFFLISSLVRFLFSQSEFLQRGERSFGGGLGYSVNRDANKLSLFAGYSYRGFLDADLVYSKANGGSVTGGVLSPIVTFYPLKQEDVEGAPTIGVSPGFSHYTSKTTGTIYEPDTAIVTWRSFERTNESTVNALQLSVAAQRRIAYWRMIFFQPILGCRFVYNRFRVGVFAPRRSCHRSTDCTRTAAHSYTLHRTPIRANNVCDDLWRCIIKYCG